MADKDITGKFVTSARQIPHNWNWDADKQQPGFDIEDYCRTARLLRVEMLQHVRQLMALCPTVVLQDDTGNAANGYTAQEYNLAGLDILIQNISADNARYLEAEKKAGEWNNSPANEAAFDNRFLKSSWRAKQKLLEPSINQSAHNIGDYLRFKLVCEDVNDVVYIRAALQSGRMGMTSQKDRFRRPHEEGGHRAYMYHALADNGKFSIKFEGMVCMRQIEELGIDRNMRALERDCLRGSFAIAHSPQLANALKEASDTLQLLRTGTMYRLCQSIGGLDDLLDKDINPNAIIAGVIKAFSHRSGVCAELMDTRFSRTTMLFASNRHARDFVVH